MMAALDMEEEYSGRRTFMYTVMRELVCNRQLWKRAAVRQLRSHNVEQREYLAATVWKNPGNDCCYLICFDINTIVWFSRLLQQVSNDDTWACWCIILDMDKMDYRLFRRKYLIGCLGKLGKVYKQ